MPIDEPDIRTSGIECIPVGRAIKHPDGKLLCSPLSFALDELGELVFADVLNDLLDLLYHDDMVELRRPCTVLYEVADGDPRIKVLDIMPVSDRIIDRIGFFGY
jgi:hypothetical protein